MNIKQNLSILVTGGAGFLGSHLCSRLLDDGNNVICVDNFFTGSKENIYPLMDNPRFESIRHDVTFPLYVEIDEIYNLACPASPIHYQNDPVQRQPDISLAREKLRWEPATELLAGLGKTIRYFESFIDTNRKTG